MVPTLLHRLCAVFIVLGVSTPHKGCSILSYCFSCPSVRAVFDDDGSGDTDMGYDDSAGRSPFVRVGRICGFIAIDNVGSSLDHGALVLRYHERSCVG